jgi:hypothetical protein
MSTIGYIFTLKDIHSGLYPGRIALFGYHHACFGVPDLEADGVAEIVDVVPRI